MLSLLEGLRHKVAIGFVGGSNLVKQQEQLGTSSIDVTSLFDFCFAENGLTAYKLGVPLSSQSFIKYIGEERYKSLVKFILHYIADLDIPIKRGTFVEYRNGMINVSPIGRNASNDERNEYQKYDLEHRIREDFVKALREEFPDYGLTYVFLYIFRKIVFIIQSSQRKDNTRRPRSLTIYIATQSAAKSPSTSSLPAGTKPTASNTSKTKPNSLAESPTPPFTSSATRHSPAAMTTRFTRTREPSVIPSRIRMTAMSNWSSFSI